MEPLKSTGKPFDIPKDLVWEAYRTVRKHDGAPGVDGLSVADFEKDLKNNLYRIWNRMSSGSYFPSPVRAVAIPKPGGGTRMLGVPTVADRIAQTVVAMMLEPRAESIFVADSFGYRVGRSPLDAVDLCVQRCRTKNWVVDLDIQDFFGSVPHDLIVKAVEVNTVHSWMVLYVKRWLAAPARLADGSLITPERGTPQGSAVSPMLANLFLHYAFDLWMEREHPGLSFERFVDDVVVHCVTRRQAEDVMASIDARLGEVGLRMHPAKTRIVYCKDSNRRGSSEHTSFTFLGYDFRPRKVWNPKKKTAFTGFSPAMSKKRLAEKSAEVRSWRIHRRTRSTIDDLATDINPIVRGWMQYWGRYHRSAMQPLLRRINLYLKRWARRKYKRLRSFTRCTAWLKGVAERDPGLFAHWEWATVA